MGYPMTYKRMIHRNFLTGGYDNQDPALSPANIRGDLRRFEQDQQDANHVVEYARLSGATEDQVRIILSKLLET